MAIVTKIGLLIANLIVLGHVDLAGLLLWDLLRSMFG
jgi:hypothetical protein